MVEQISHIVSGNVKPACMGVSRTNSLDVLKCFAAFCVVWIHFGIVWLSPITRCAVPFFFIITGYYYPIMVEKGHLWRHIRRILVMVLCASVLYGVVELQQQIRHDTLEEWIVYNIRFKHIVGLVVFDNDMFGFHLWYFYAVLYNLVIFYFADKWKLTKWLRYAAFFLLFLFFAANFTPWYPKFRNFLFMGLPCMMIGRCIRESKDQAFCFLSNQRYLWVYTLGSFLLIVGEMWLFSYMYPEMDDYGTRDMFVFTLTLLLPYFYWALRHPSFGEGSLCASIGRKYSAYIYIFHIFAARLLTHIFEREDSLLSEAIYPFIVFGISLCMAWLFTQFMRWFKCHF